MIEYCMPSEETALDSFSGAETQNTFGETCSIIRKFGLKHNYVLYIRNYSTTTMTIWCNYGNGHFPRSIGGLHLDSENTKTYLDAVVAFRTFDEVCEGEISTQANKQRRAHTQIHTHRRARTQNHTLTRKYAHTHTNSHP